MKKISLTVIIFMLLIMFTSSVCAAPELEIKAPSAILVEKSTGTVMYEKNADEKMCPASVTKVMTILLIMEAIENKQFGYDDIVTASAYATSMGGSQVYLKEGEQMTVDEMLKCIIIASANDACVAMAEFVSGSVDAFVSMMNERAKQLGMTNTSFINCTGLDADGHLTTARDISIMSRELIKHEDVKKYTTIWMDSIRDGQFGLTNTNKLIRFYDKATGLKTGYTKKSMYCVSATAKQDNMELIAVVMAAPSIDERSADAKTLLNYGFARYSLYSASTQQLPVVPVIKGKCEYIEPITEKMINVIIEKGSDKDINYNVNVCKDVEAPVAANQKLGEVTLMLGDKMLTSSDVISPIEVRRASIIDIFMDILNYFLIH